MRAAATAFVLGLAVAAACGDDAGPAPAVASADGPASAGPKAAPPPPYVTVAQAGEVVGHLRIADPAALLAKLEGVVPARWASMVEAEAARALLGAVLPAPPSGALTHLALTQVAACAVLDPAKRAQPLVCIAGYDGGIAQLATDLGPDGVVDDGQAALHLSRDGGDWYFDALGDHVVFARQADAFEVAKPTLVALSHPGSTRDLEVVVHASHILESHRSALSQWVVAQANAATADASADPWTRAVVAQAASTVGLQAVEEALSVLAAVERIEWYGSVTPTAISLGLAVVAIPDSPVHGWIDGSTRLPPAMWQWLPSGTWLGWGRQRHRNGPLLPHTRRLLARAVGEMIGGAVGRTAAEVETAALALGDAQDEVYGDWTLLAAFNSPATRGGGVLVRPILPGADARTTWLAVAQAATPRAVFGDRLGASIETMVSWRVVPNARTLHGLTVDEWRLSAAPGLLDDLTQRLEPGGVGQQIVAALRGREALLAIQRFEVEGAVAMVFAPGGSPHYASKVIRARQGEGRMTTTGVDGALGEGTATTLLAVSAYDLIQGVREMVPADLRTSLPRPVGQDLSDAFVRVRASEGVLSHELVLSSAALGVAADAIATVRSPPTK